MKTTNINENLRCGEIEISVSFGQGLQNISVNAVERSGERTTSATLEYKAADGTRITEVQDFSAPFDNDFYDALDAHIVKLAGVIVNDGEERA